MFAQGQVPLFWLIFIVVLGLLLVFAHGRVPNWNVNMCASSYKRRVYHIVSSYLYLYLYLYLYWIWICARAVTRGEFTTLVLHICICICIYIDCEYAQCRQLQGEGLPHWSLAGSGSEQCPPFSHHLYPHPSPPPSRLFFHLLMITNFLQCILAVHYLTRDTPILVR